MKSSIPVYDIDSISHSQNDDILVSRFDVYSKDHQHLHSPHRHKFYHFVLFTEGSGTHAVDFQRFEVKPYQVYFMIPGQVHSWNFAGPVNGYIVNFSETFFQSFLHRPDYLEKFSFFSGSVTDQVLDIPEEFRDKIVVLFENILEEQKSNGKMAFDYIRTLLLNIFILISRFATDHQQSTGSTYNYTLLRNFQNLIERNYTTLRLPKEYAKLLYITPNHLNALCNDMLGIPAGEVIRNRTILEAKRLLINLELSISEIAYQLNFADNSYFTKFFKKQAGVTPEEFRRKALKQETYESIRN